MANHYRHEPTTRRDRAIEAILELLTRLIETWVEFWWSTEPGEHAQGATDRFADTLHDIDITALHDGLTADSGRYALLGPDDTAVIPRTPTPAQLLAHVVSIDGGRIGGDLFDQNGGAVS